MVELTDNDRELLEIIVGWYLHNDFRIRHDMEICAYPLDDNSVAQL